ncbi:IclR family transcriptional regulator [Nocardioides insulae]|uniref:IclR family transcriptional regulator n=1 Tax=Nocardioides insulae TaxID=394734 RepID=UPI0003FF2CEF|nr:IclR family transcriptional regulator C-terminal domain-containing protein [Nocardioides insulae]
MSTLANARAVLELIVARGREITVSDVVAELGVPKSSASRTLSEMAKHGLLVRDSSRAYRPAPLVISAAQVAGGSRSVLAVLEESLEVLVAATGYTGYVNVLDGRDSVVLLLRMGSNVLQAHTPPGYRAPAFATSMGRAILSRSDRATALGDPRLGADYGSAPSTAEELGEDLDIVLRRGWSYSRGEYVDGVFGVSAAVRDPATGQVHGIGIAIASDEVAPQLRDEMGAAVRAAAGKAGRAIGDDYWVSGPDGR